jgi:hypothetical protein
VKINWTKGLVGEEKEEMKRLFLSNAFFRKRAQLLVQDKIDTIRQKNITETAYDSPNWALKQADAVGYERALQEVINLLES